MRSFVNLSIPSFFLLLISCLTLARAARFDITNNCSYAATRLRPDVAPRCPAGTAAAWIWASTNCLPGLWKTPNTLAEFALNQYMNLDFIDMSLIDGFNVPMEFSSTSGGCDRVIKCTADIIGQCPAALKVPGGCNEACPALNRDEFCCNSGSCGPTDYSRYFKDRCPNAYSYPKDDPTRVFTCPGGTNYKAVFCP
ncbi:hypothetical protein ACJRO7_019612 [Eucalyptus globulus]|uniref:Thaumatin-like protein n=1 Tax=Eucalyptus globulus TaxID=34317 RepID=A0ABD3KFH5_EUCGL